MNNQSITNHRTTNMRNTEAKKHTMEINPKTMNNDTKAMQQAMQQPWAKQGTTQ